MIIPEASLYMDLVLLVPLPMMMDDRLHSSWQKKKRKDPFGVNFAVNVVARAVVVVTEELVDFVEVAVAVDFGFAEWMLPTHSDDHSEEATGGEAVLPPHAASSTFITFTISSTAFAS